MKFKSNNNIIYSCKYHVIWCPKYRRKVLINDVESRLKEIISSIALQKKCDLIEMKIMPDHIHLLLEVDPQFGIHRMVRHLKGSSSRLLRQEFPSLKSRIPTLLQERWHCSPCGLKGIQRDLYSAFLALHVNDEKLNRAQAEKAWASGGPLLEQALLRCKETAKGKQRVASFGLSQR